MLLPFKGTIKSWLQTEMKNNKEKFITEMADLIVVPKMVASKEREYFTKIYDNCEAYTLSIVDKL